MITQKKADLTLAYHQDKLLENQNLAYLSVVARLDEKGHSTEDYYIEAGVLRVDVQDAAAADIAGAKKMSGDEEYVPTKLPVPSEGKCQVPHECDGLYVIPTPSRQTLRVSQSL